MGRWTFEGGAPLYIPDPGEEGGGSAMGHLASGVGQTAQDAGDLLASVAGLPGISHALTALGAPMRAVTATGHALAGSTGTTDPINYILTGFQLIPQPGNRFLIHQFFQLWYYRQAVSQGHQFPRVSDTPLDTVNQPFEVSHLAQQRNDLVASVGITVKPVNDILPLHQFCDVKQRLRQPPF